VAPPLALSITLPDSCDFIVTTSSRTCPAEQQSAFDRFLRHRVLLSNHGRAFLPYALQGEATFGRFVLSSCRSGRPWTSVYRASVGARARQPRTLHCAGYPHTSSWGAGICQRPAWDEGSEGRFRANLWVTGMAPSVPPIRERRSGEQPPRDRRKRR